MNHFINLLQIVIHQAEVNAVYTDEHEILPAKFLNEAPADFPRLVLLKITVESDQTILERRPQLRTALYVIVKHKALFV
jgi:hypothetical protein